MTLADFLLILFVLTVSFYNYVDWSKEISHALEIENMRRLHLGLPLVSAEQYKVLRREQRAMRATAHAEKHGLEHTREGVEA